ncbi:hypothetical protein LX92_02814 [Maribacter polysiphoniae]|uniref:Uncharacterized protein n=1 Tax=Maribacter polysiphoniae TaxID=429344 RepID=A0A316DYP7_9FLAO|nr:hypothetical protein LX92_02814 [Maribacter polysiphoniae]
MLNTLKALPRLSLKIMAIKPINLNKIIKMIRLSLITTNHGIIKK